MNIKQFITDRIVDEWKNAWKWASVQLAIIAGAVASYAVSYPADFAKMVEILPSEIKPFIPIIVMGLPIIARLKKTPDKA